MFVIKWECISFLLAAMTNDHKLDNFKHQKCIFSQFWGLKVQNQSVSMATLFLKALGKTVFFASSNFWWLLAFLDMCTYYSSSMVCPPKSASKVTLPPLLLWVFSVCPLSLDLGPTWKTEDDLLTSRFSI